MHVRCGQPCKCITFYHVMHQLFTSPSVAAKRAFARACVHVCVYVCTHERLDDWWHSCWHLKKKKKPKVSQDVSALKKGVIWIINFCHGCVEGRIASESYKLLKEILGNITVSFKEVPQRVSIRKPWRECWGEHPGGQVESRGKWTCLDP